MEVLSSEFSDLRTSAFGSSVYVSTFLISGSIAEDAFLHAQGKHATLFGSIPILTETAHVFRTKFHQSEEDFTAALKLIGYVAAIVVTISQDHGP